MSDLSHHLAGRGRRARKYQLRPVALILAPILAILFQIYSPRFITQLSFLELPLLVTVYFSLMRREPIAGILIGCSIGLAQDAFSHNPIGVYGIVKTLVGYFAASLSLRVDVENQTVRFLIGFCFYFFHQFVYWTLSNALLAQQLPLDLGQIIVFSGLNGAVAVPLFGLLDRL